MEDYIYNINSEDIFIDNEVDEYNDAEESILYDNGEDIDNVGDISDEDVENYEDDNLDYYTIDDTCDEEDCDTIDYEVSGSTEYIDDEEEDDDDNIIYDVYEDEI